MCKRKQMVEKIAQLLALAESSNYEGETYAATRKAAELMAKYQIESAELSSSGSETEGFTEQKSTERHDRPEYTLANSIAKLNGVLLILVSKKRQKNKFLKVVGTPSNLEAYNYMLGIVTTQRERALSIYLDSAMIISQPLDSTDIRHWKMGFAVGVGRKVDELLENAKSIQKEWGLVVVDPVKAAENWLNENGTQLTTRQNRAVRYSSAGMNSGKDVNLNKGVSHAGGSVAMLGMTPKLSHH